MKARRQQTIADRGCGRVHKDLHEGGESLLGQGHDSTVSVNHKPYDLQALGQNIFVQADPASADYRRKLGVSDREFGFDKVERAH